MTTSAELTAWPLPNLDLISRLNDGERLSPSDRYVAASCLAAYVQMVFDPRAKRQRVIRALRQIRSPGKEPRT